jgi:hypothetical protein
MQKIGLFVVGAYDKVSVNIVPPYAGTKVGLTDTIAGRAGAEGGM